MAPSYAGPGRAKAHYQIETAATIKSMGKLVKLLAAEDSFLFLWVPNALVPLGLEVMAAWGYAYKTMITWVKTTKDGKPRIGGGHYTRGCTEQLLLGRGGLAKVRAHNVPNVILAPRGRHSEKPDQSYDLIERLCKGPYLELYARRQYSELWSVWGNQL
jgi:N6-adenosine-specific RNA methylase IME4